ncbi:MAG: Ig-like domain-containing protein [Verrucomicrobiota bacterium]
MTATVRSSPPQILLGWQQDMFDVPDTYTIYRKTPGATSWGEGITLPGMATSFADFNVMPGAAYEYQLVKANWLFGYSGYGYICAGIEAPVADDRGKLVLIVDRTHAAALGAELARLQQDLAGDGWTVSRHDVAREDSVVNVKNLIAGEYAADPARVKAVFLFGHVPVPYSGDLAADGHSPQHRGAWPADVYYGVMANAWTDSAVNNTGAENARNWNVPGDGKFDQTLIPAPVDLQVGRVDLANLPAFNQSERELLRQYLNKNHQYRHAQMPVMRRGLIHDSIGVGGGSAYAASAWRNFAPWFGPANVTAVPAGVWFPLLASQNYQWACGFGAGSYFSVAGLGNSGAYYEGTTWDFAFFDTRAVFYMLLGSWLADWDSPNNIMRATLATRSSGLACITSGRPHWFGHHMGLGETIGFSTRLTQNNSGLYRNHSNPFMQRVHFALMGDPTLRLHPVAPPAELRSDIVANGVRLSWSASPDAVAGYHVYRAADPLGPFARLTASPVSGDSYTDATFNPGSATYMVRAVKLENTPSGTYYNPSQGVFATVNGNLPPLGDTEPPSVAVTAPANGAPVSGAAVVLTAEATDDVGVVGVQFKINGVNLGVEDSAEPYEVTWDTTTAVNGSYYTLTAVARDAAGNQTTSIPVVVVVNNSSGGGNEGGNDNGGAGGSAVVWFDDQLPAGAIAMAEGGDAWNWVSSNPAPFSGTRAHQSTLSNGIHHHYFSWAGQTLSVGAGDVLYAYVYLDPVNPPREIMLGWSSTASGWSHGAYWGADVIPYGANGTNTRRYLGPLPLAGQWVRLEVPADQVGLAGATVQGMGFVLSDGRVTWDAAGKITR